MNWTDIQNWKQCFISTFICLIGCSIGVMGTAFYLLNYNLFFVLLLSLIAGFISCMVFMVFFCTLFHKMNFLDAVKHSYKMSIVSILIMMLTETTITLLIAPELLSHQMHLNTSHGFNIMLLAIGLGYLFSLPYNYYQLQKTGKICHEKSTKAL